MSPASPRWPPPFGYGSFHFCRLAAQFIGVYVQNHVSHSIRTPTAGNTSRIALLIVVVDFIILFLARLLDFHPRILAPKDSIFAKLV